MAHAKHTITRAGFEREEMENMFREAGCVDIAFADFREGTRVGDGDGEGPQVGWQRMFVVRGRRA